MEINADFNTRAVVHAAAMEWQPSPMTGVDRRMLDRMGGEVARATSIVRYAPGSHFSAHVHTGGEEFLVLDGVFQDEHGDFPVGTYVRNPPTSSHTPGSELGCTIFVKLWQFDMGDRTQIKVDVSKKEYHAIADQPGVKRMDLYLDSNEKVSVESWEPGSTVRLNADNGMEILVLAGNFREAGDEFVEQSWLRLPKNTSSIAVAGEQGAKVWIKRDHLAKSPQT